MRLTHEIQPVKIGSGDIESAFRFERLDISALGSPLKEMRRHMKRKIVAIGTAALLLAASVGTSPANASPQDEAPVVITTGMNATGFDESVAEANGFQIVTYPDGTWESVAVTPEAKKIEAGYGGSVLVDPNSPIASKVTVSGNCGTSFIEVLNSGSAKRINTGYSVTAPVANRTIWVVQVSSLGGLPSYSFPPAPSGASWVGSLTFSTGGFGGFAYVTPGSSVLLINGTICGSGSPAEGY